MHTRHLLVPALALAALLVAGAPARASGAAPGAHPVAAPAGPHMVLPFVHDDWTRAVALARARKVPVFVEAWAPW